MNDEDGFPLGLFCGVLLGIFVCVIGISAWSSSEYILVTKVGSNIHHISSLEDCKKLQEVFKETQSICIKEPS